MRRPKPSAGQLTFVFPEILEPSKPSVTLHKNGRYLLFKANDVFAADVLRELELRMPVTMPMSTGLYYGIMEASIVVRDYRRVELWKHLGGDIGQHPYCELLRTYGVEVGTSSTLKNYILKESRRRTLEATPFPAPKVLTDVTLFDRCSVGTNLRCIKDLILEGDGVAKFVAGRRYLVIGAGGEGVDNVVISTREMTSSAVIDVAGAGPRHEWTPFDPPMEEWFDDSEETDFGVDLREAYPDRVQEKEEQLARLNLPLYEHVRIDAAMESLKRGVVNAKLMRMGKSSEAIAICELWGSRKIAIVSTENIRIFWVKEMDRLGVKDYQVVSRLTDLKKPARYYLLTYSWIKQMEDRTASLRRKFTNYLRPSERTVSRKVTYHSRPQDIIVYQHNNCPHCEVPLLRPILHQDAQGKVFKVEWSSLKGYICRNKSCSWQSDNRGMKGAAWNQKGNAKIHHKPGTYIDYGLARHARCSGDQIKGRMCLECGQVDGAWTPPLYRRFHKKFTAVVADEIHNAKSRSTQTAQALYSLRARRRLGLTGTPMSNSALDVYWPLHWILRAPCGQFKYSGTGGVKEFEDRFCDHVYLEKPTGDVDEEGNEVTKTVRKRIPFLVNPPDFWRFIAPKIVRRNYADPLYQQSLIDAGLKQPKVEVKTIRCPMHHKQLVLMLSALRDFRQQYEAMAAQAKEKHQEVNQALVITRMSALRTIATAPERLNQRLQMQVYDGPGGGGKIRHIVNIVKERCAAGGKVVILSDFVDMQKRCEESLDVYKPIRFQTHWDGEARAEAFRSFAEDEDRNIFIAGTRAIREGVDLSVADTTVCCDLLWSPAFQMQAWSRTMAATIRERTCEVYLMLSLHSLDEHIYNIFYSKMIAAEQAMDRKVMNRRAIEIDIKFFVERVLEEEEKLTLQLRDMGEDLVFMPSLNTALLEERIA